MTEHKIVHLPPADELLHRLTEVDDEPHLIERFYPLLLKAAGQERSGPGIALLLVLSVADYTEGQPIFLRTVMEMRLPSFVPALTDDPEVRADALAHLRAVGIG